MNYNRVVLVGRMVRDPEIRQTADDKLIGRFTVAVNRPIPKDSDDRAVDFFNVVAFGSTADFVRNYAFKGRLVLVEGRLQTRQYNGRDGVVCRAFEVLTDRVVLLDSSKRQDSESDSRSKDADDSVVASNSLVAGDNDDGLEYDPFL